MFLTKGILLTQGFRDRGHENVAKIQSETVEATKKSDSEASGPDNVHIVREIRRSEKGIFTAN